MGVDFSSVNLRILSPDGKTVLAELQTIDKVGQRTAQNAGRIGANLGRSVSAARSLAFAATGVSSGINGAANAAGVLAEQIALSTRNAKIAAGATGLAAIVAVAVSLGIVWKNATDELKEFNRQLNAIGSDTEIAQLRGRGPASDRKAQREAIWAAGEKELEQARKIKNEDERRVLLAAIYKRTREQIAALDREFIRTRDRAYGQERAAVADEIRLLEMQRSAAGMGPLTGARFQRTNEARMARDQALRELARDAEEKGYTDAQVGALGTLIRDRFAAESKLIEAELVQQAAQIGDAFVTSLAGSIADGISTAISAGGIGAGFKALTGSILIGLGDMMIEIGTQSLLAAKLMLKIVTALRAFAPEGAIGPALLLIAAGGTAKGLGASMGGAGGGGSGGGGSGSYSSGTIIDRGLVNPGNGVVTAPGTIRPRETMIFAPTIIGTDDPRAQRDIYRMWDRARVRRGG